MDLIDEHTRVVGRRLGQDSVPEVEDVADRRAGSAVVTPARLDQNLAGTLDEERGRPEEQRWVEVPLERDAGPETAPGFAKGHSPVESDHVRADSGEQIHVS